MKQDSKSSPSEYREILADFIKETVGKNNTGWWFRIPMLRETSKEVIWSCPQDIIMPQLGSIFGLTERAIAIVLIKMGCLTQMKSASGELHTRIKMKGWEFMKSQFKVSDYLEATPYQFTGQGKV